jgi:hypothetical protein
MTTDDAYADMVAEVIAYRFALEALLNVLQRHYTALNALEGGNIALVLMAAEMALDTTDNRTRKDTDNVS